MIWYLYLRPILWSMLALLYGLPVSCGREFRLGMMSPKTHPRLSWATNAAAATMAIDQAYLDNILVGNTARVIWRDDGCNPKIGAGTAVLFRDEDDIDAFIGPPCSTATRSAGYLASFWNLPMFSQASTDPALSNKDIYTTLVRMGPPFSKMGAAMVEVFNYFGWRRVVMVSRRFVDQRLVFCDYASRSMDEKFRTGNFTLAEWIKIDDGISSRKIDELLERIKRRGRIIVMCMNLNDELNILERATSHAMTNGDYVFITIDHLPPTNVDRPWLGAVRRPDLIPAYRAVLQVTLSAIAGPEVMDFRRRVPIKMTEPPWNYNGTLEAGKMGSEYAAFLFDIVYLYLLTLNETLRQGENPRNGTHMFHVATGLRFEGVTGPVAMDDNGDREPNYWLWHMNQNNSQFVPWAEIRMIESADERFHWTGPGTWITADGNAPPDTPPCGFFNEFCHDISGRSAAIGGSVAGLAVLIIIIVLLQAHYRRKRFEDQIKSMLWRVTYADIELFGQNRKESMSQMSLARSRLSMATSGTRDDLPRDLNQPVGLYKGSTVCVQKLNITNLSLTRQDHLDLNSMRQLTHENVNSFVGLCIDPPNVAVLMLYCQRGTLQDILENDDFKLDWMFKISLLSDLVNGIQYLHSSPLQYHGSLTSDKCVVDNRWVLKVTGYGPRRILKKCVQEGEVGEYQKYKEMLWTAPELLRQDRAKNLEAAIHKKADTYSFGMIVQEVVYRCMPFPDDNSNPKEIVERVIKGEDPPFRPRIKELSIEDSHPGAVVLMESCWHELPDERPEFPEVKKSIKSFYKGKKTNIMDNMLNIMEKYANNLEDIVLQRTEDLVEEKKKTDSLLYRMLPQSVAEELKSGRPVQPESFESVTIFFSDIVGFTALSSESEPLQVVDLLNDLYTLFDDIIDQHDVYKVETIGDAYMVASGLPGRNEDRHSGEIATMALDLLSAVYTQFRIRHRPDTQLLLRVGVHTGPCVAGVVGLTMPRYCLFGDTVNTASRMESNGEALRIHISETTRDALANLGKYEMVERGYVQMKGKGNQMTYWLVGKKAYTKTLPTVRPT